MSTGVQACWVSRWPWSQWINKQMRAQRRLIGFRPFELKPHAKFLERRRDTTVDFHFVTFVTPADWPIDTHRSQDFDRWVETVVCILFETKRQPNQGGVVPKPCGSGLDWIVWHNPSRIVFLVKQVGSQNKGHWKKSATCFALQLRNSQTSGEKCHSFFLSAQIHHLNSVVHHPLVRIYFCHWLLRSQWIRCVDLPVSLLITLSASLEVEADLIRD